MVYTSRFMGQRNPNVYGTQASKMRTKEDAGYGGGTTSKPNVVITLSDYIVTHMSTQSTNTKKRRSYNKVDTSEEVKPISDIDKKRDEGLGNGGSDMIIQSFETVGREEDSQRSRLRYVNRYLPPFYRSIAVYGRRPAPRRWR